MSHSEQKGEGDWIEECAPAKINLALHVTGQMSNGYHKLHSLVMFAGVGDVVRLRPILQHEKQKDTLSFCGPFGALLAMQTTDKDTPDLVKKTLTCFRMMCPDHVPEGIQIKLEKNLPIASGIGGGSADAGAMLRLLCRLSSKPVAHDKVLEMAAHLGADVPVCTLAQAAEIGDIGGRLRFLPHLPKVYLVLVNLGKPLSTAEVFRALEHKHNDPLPPIPFLFNNHTDFTLWLKNTRNDLQVPAVKLMTQISDVIELVRAQPSCVLARMSGSGATVFGLFGSAREAQYAAAQIRQQAPDFWCAACETL